jgi:cell division protein FtsB
MRLVQLTLLVLIIVLQYRLWFAENGMADKKRLEREIAEQQIELNAQKAKNDVLQARVDDLKSGDDAIEELARQNLGLIKPGETFIIMTEEQ